MSPAARPQWQQVTALLTLGASGAVTGLSLVPQAAADLTSPASLPIKLLALERSTGPAPGGDAMLRSAVVHVARNFLHQAQTRSPAEMEALIWHYASTDGADHGPSCGAFASLTLELGSQLAGHESWATGGASYPWAVHTWVDGRVDPNPASPGIVSVLQDAQAHGRWHPLGDGYTPQAGDWVLFDGHVEVVTKYFGGVLHTIGGDSMPNLSVNAHEYAGPLQDQGVAGFVDNGLSPSARPTPAAPAPAWPGRAGDAAKARGTAKAGGPAHQGTPADGPQQQPMLAPRAIPAPRAVPRSRYAPQARALPAQGAQPGPDTGRSPAAAPRAGQAARVVSHELRPQVHQRISPIPGTGPRYVPHPAAQPAHRPAQRRAGQADVPATGMRPATARRAGPGEAAIPGLFRKAHHQADATALPPYHRHGVAPAPALPVTAAPLTAAQQAFIREVAQGAMATQRKYGVPASVTIAQAIDESAWGQSALAINDHNLFGIKGTGPAGSDVLPTQEVIGGQVVNTSAPFRIYQSVAQSIDAHARLLARSSYYVAAMSQSHNPNAFAGALTGVYATDPAYGAKLIQLMQQYDLYRYDHAAGAGSGSSGIGHGKAHPHGPRRAGTAQPGSIWAPGQTPDPASLPAQSHPPNSGLPAHLPQPGPIWAPGRAASPQGPTGSPQPSHPAGPTQSPEPGPIWAPGQPPASGHAGAPRSPARRSPTPAHAEVIRHTASVAQAHPAQPDPTANPAPTPYPGRSPRPAPLRHPARPAGAAHASGLRQAPGPGTAPQPEHHGSPPRDSGRGAPAAATSGQPGTGSGLANGSADAAIPGLSAAPVPHARDAHPRARAGPGPVEPGGATIPGAGLGAPGAHGAPATRRRPAPSAHGVPRAHVPGAHVPAADAVPGAHGVPGAHAVPGTHGPRAPGARAVSAAGGTPISLAGGSKIPGAWQPGTAGVAATGRASSTPTDTGATAPAGGSSIPGAEGPGLARAATGHGAHAHHGAAGTPPARRNNMPAATGGTGRTVGTAPAARAAAAVTTAAVTTAAVRTSAVRTAAGSSATAGATAPRTETTHGTLTAYHAHIPPAVREAFVTSARMPLLRAEPLYADVASHTGIRWEILAACDWMQCKARRGVSPVYGEKLGALNADGTCYRTRSAALQRCAYDLVQLAGQVYQLDIATSHELSVRDLANVFAAYRWGALLRQHSTSALDFPYSVAGLTADHTHMRWPNIDAPDAPDKPGSRFRDPFGAVPVALGLNYQALA